jgi:hypothetical protein
MARNSAQRTTDRVQVFEHAVDMTERAPLADIVRLHALHH